MTRSEALKLARMAWGDGAECLRRLDHRNSVSCYVMDVSDAGLMARTCGKGATWATACRDAGLIA